MECHFCGSGLKVDDVLQRLYVLREVPAGLREMVGRYTYMEEIFAHLECPSLGVLMRSAAEKDYERRVAVDKSQDAEHLQPNGSRAAMEYVQERHE